ncbi:hypothetical protein BXZ70DRAFT_932371 [Cristinia sonorae]|uniref:Uncharacterized protein n=1 Tax=Cristinia sonorae TaxID=1940300 RepID=A0A8K0URR7_9AGAR|nr:hypothetical protein BXZ70DRAFT_932371 [Cristinia sonorae]
MALVLDASTRNWTDLKHRLQTRPTEIHVITRRALALLVTLFSHFNETGEDRGRNLFTDVNKLVIGEKDSPSSVRSPVKKISPTDLGKIVSYLPGLKEITIQNISFSPTSGEREEVLMIPNPPRDLSLLALQCSFHMLAEVPGTSRPMTQDCEQAFELYRVLRLFRTIDHLFLNVHGPCPSFPDSEPWLDMIDGLRLESPKIPLDVLDLAMVHADAGALDILRRGGCTSELRCITYRPTPHCSDHIGAFQRLLDSSPKLSHFMALPYKCLDGEPVQMITPMYPRFDLSKCPRLREIHFRARYNIGRITQRFHQDYITAWMETLRPLGTCLPHLRRVTLEFSINLVQGVQPRLTVGEILRDIFSTETHKILYEIMDNTLVELCRDSLEAVVFGVVVIGNLSYEREVWETSGAKQLVQRLMPRMTRRGKLSWALSRVTE